MGLAQSNFAKMIQAVVQKSADEITPYRAQVTGLSGNKIAFLEPGDPGPTQAYYARIAGSAIAVNDWVLVIGRKNPIVIGKILT